MTAITSSPREIVLLSDLRYPGDQGPFVLDEAMQERSIVKTRTESTAQRVISSLIGSQSDETGRRVGVVRVNSNNVEITSPAVSLFRRKDIGERLPDELVLGYATAEFCGQAVYISIDQLIRLFNFFSSPLVDSVMSSIKIEQTPVHPVQIDDVVLSLLKGRGVEGERAQPFLRSAVSLHQRLIERLPLVSKDIPIVKGSIPFVDGTVLSMQSVRKPDGGEIVELSFKGKIVGTVKTVRRVIFLDKAFTLSGVRMRARHRNSPKDELPAALVVQNQKSLEFEERVVRYLFDRGVCFVTPFKPVHCLTHRGKIIEYFVPGVFEDLWSRQERIEGLDPAEFRQELMKILPGLCGILFALHQMHGMNYFHCDLKPENILLSLEGFPQLIDFSGANLGTPETVIEGVASGTLGFMLPSLFETNARPHPQTVDMFAIGMVFLELVHKRYEIYVHEGMYGETIFPSDQGEFTAWLKQLNLIVQQEAEFALQQNKEETDPLFREINTLIFELLSQKPAHSPSAEECLVRLLNASSVLKEQFEMLIEREKARKKVIVEGGVPPQ